MTAPMTDRRRVAVLPFIVVWVLGGIAHQVRSDAHAGVVSARALWRSWVTEKWPKVHPAIRKPVFAVGVSARAVYRAGHYGGRTVAIGARNGATEGMERHREYRELAEHPRGTTGREHVAERIAGDRQARRAGYGEYGEHVHQRAVRDREERAAWAEAETLADAGALTALWADGEMLYHPGGYDEGPDEETAPIAGSLATLNRAGFVTSSSQPGHGPVKGYDGRWWSQRAAVDGFTDKATADRLEDAATEAGLIIIRNGPAGWRTTQERWEPVTAGRVGEDPITDDSDYFVHTGFGTHRSRHAVKTEFGYGAYATPALLNAEQVTIIDPEWGRADLLWATLTENVGPPITAMTTPKPTAGPTVTRNGGTETAGGIPAYPAEHQDGDWQVTYTAVDGSVVTETGVSQEYAEQLAAWRRWRNDGKDGTPVTAEPIPNDTGADPVSQPINLDPHRNNNNGGSEMAGYEETTQQIAKFHAGNSGRNARYASSNGEASGQSSGGGGVSAPMTTGANVADNTTTPQLRAYYEEAAQRFAELNDHVTAHAEWCTQSAASMEAIVGNLTADRHPASTVAVAAQHHEAVTGSAEHARNLQTTTEAAKSSAEHGVADLESARAMEDAHAAFPGGPAQRTDAYAQS